MFLTIVLIALPVVPLAIAAEPPGGYYTTRYDHFDIENILNQKRLVVYYAACLLDKGPCTPQGTEFKSILPEAIKTNCLRCTEKQRVVTTRSIRRLQKEYPDIWSQLERKWDSKGENVKRLLASVNKPKPVTTIVPLIFDKFGEDDSVDTSETSTPEASTMSSTIKTSTPVASSSTLLNALMTTPPTSIQSATATSTFAPTKQTTTIPAVVSSSTLIDILTTKPTPATFTLAPPKRPSIRGGIIAFRPFNSIGPNLIVPNPKILLNKVIYTANMVFNTVLKG